jgi:NAD-dependent SIR2 family protein deacetylase
MKDKQKMIVLGAGASIGSKRYPIESSFRQMRTTMPSSDNFFYDLFKTNKTDKRPAGALNFLGLTFEGLNDLIARSWNINNEGFDHAEWKGVNIEDVMTFFEVGSRMHPRGSVERRMFARAQEYLLNFMHPLIPMICEGQHCEYLLRTFYDIDKKDTIISYNWDTIADHTLEQAGRVQLRNYAKLLRADSIVPEEWRHKGLLLKLHGSFNWLVCENKACENRNRILPPFQRNRYKLLRKLWTCPHCGNNRLKPQIVPPVSNKMIHKDSFLRNQWMIAREKLLDVNELVFIGYSFPPTDHYSAWLFRQLNLIEDRSAVKVVVVNPEYGKRSSEVTKRYNSIFSRTDIESYKSLQEYSESEHGI